MSRSPIATALVMSPPSTRSSVASAAAQQTGLPPKVEPWDPLSQVSDYRPMTSVRRR